MLRVVVVNPKGGSGKTTVATNLASYYASQNHVTALMDYDTQGSGTYWGSLRDGGLPPIQIVPAFRQPVGMTRSFMLRLPSDVSRVIVDTPAALDLNDFRPTLQQAGAILVPVLPSDVDIHAVSRCIADLLLVAKINRKAERIAVIANRVRRNTLMYQKLEAFLGNLGIPFVATFRDTQNYVKAFEAGRGIFEMELRGLEADRQSWQNLLQWLESRPPVEVTGLSRSVVQ